MAVRFLPLPPEGAEPEPRRDRENLAEVIDLRSRIGGVPEASAAAGRASAEPSNNVSVLSFGRSVPVGVDEGHGVGEGGNGTDGDRAGEGGDGDEGGGFGGGAAAAFGGTAGHGGGAERTVAEDAIRLLARRARSSGELRRELTALGHDSADVEATVLDCESSLYLDDLGLARAVAEGLRERKRASRAQIRVKLRERLLPDGVIEEALGVLDDDEEYELLRHAASERARKLQSLDREVAERRLIGFLARRGWSGERAVRVARQALDATATRGTVRFR